MSKRFIDTSTLNKAFRKLDPSLKLHWYYLWNNCDKSGVWEIDEDLFEFENGIKFELKKLKKHFSESIDFCGDLLLIKDFIKVNNGVLKVGYNPHKPAFRDIEKNNLKLKPSLNQAYFKLVDRDRDIEEDKDVKIKKDEIKFIDAEIYPTFEDFWNLYDKKTGRENVIKIWSKLKQSEKELIINHIPLYKQSQPDKKFRKNPQTYLNNKSWNDEIINSNNGNRNSNNKQTDIELKQSASRAVDKMFSRQ